MQTPRIILIMGVTGSGKTTVGHLLADSLGWAFSDADDFHPPANVAKMSAGIALTDDDRDPWLTALRSHIECQLAADQQTVVACSALKAAYRTRLIPDSGLVHLVYLKGATELLAARLANRSGHFAPPALLTSQLATLEPPVEALMLDIAVPPEQLVTEISSRCGLKS